MGLCSDDACLVITQKRPAEVTLLFKNRCLSQSLFFSSGKIRRDCISYLNFCTGEDESGLKGRQVCVHIKQLPFCPK